MAKHLQPFLLLPPHQRLEAHSFRLDSEVGHHCGQSYSCSSPGVDCKQGCSNSPGQSMGRAHTPLDRHAIPQLPKVSTVWYTLYRTYYPVRYMVRTKESHYVRDKLGRLRKHFSFKESHSEPEPAELLDQSALTPTLLLIQFPWLTGFNSSNRIPTLLNVIGYSCARLMLKMTVLAVVNPAEMENCISLCGSQCACAPGEHRSMAHRNIAKHATGERNILFIHADMWINLNGWARVLRLHGNHSITPFDGLLGTNYMPTSSLCLREVSDTIARKLRASDNLGSCLGSGCPVERQDILSLFGLGRRRWYQSRMHGFGGSTQRPCVSQLTDGYRSIYEPMCVVMDGLTWCTYHGTHNPSSGRQSMTRSGKCKSAASLWTVHEMWLHLPLHPCLP